MREKSGWLLDKDTTQHTLSYLDARSLASTSGVNQFFKTVAKAQASKRAESVFGISVANPLRELMQRDAHIDKFNKRQPIMSLSPSSTYMERFDSINGSTRFKPAPNTAYLACCLFNNNPALLLINNIKNESNCDVYKTVVSLDQDHRIKIEYLDAKSVKKILYMIDFPMNLYFSSVNPTFLEQDLKKLVYSAEFYKVNSVRELLHKWSCITTPGDRESLLKVWDSSLPELEPNKKCVIC